MEDKTKCRSCGAAVRWVGKAILDASPVEGGNIEIVGTTVRYASKERPLFDAGPRYVSHFATCPQAKAWRKKQPVTDRVIDEVIASRKIGL